MLPVWKKVKVYHNIAAENNYKNYQQNNHLINKKETEFIGKLDWK